MKHLATAIGAAFFVGSPAHANVWSSVSDDASCMIAGEWELGTTILFAKSKTDDIMKDDVIFVISNENWSLRKDESLDFTLTVTGDDGEYFSNEPVSIDRGMAMVTDTEAMNYFRNTDTAIVKKGDEQIAILDWGTYDFAVKLSQFESCITAARAPIVEADRQRRVREAVPVDPFAKAQDANRAEAERTKED
jgi:hypothetical protein